MNAIVNASQMRELLTAEQPPVLIHVLPQEHFAHRHLKGAKNACIYEMTFIDQVRELVPDTSAAIIVYDEGAPALGSEVAAARLRAAGYTNVADFRGGLRAWVAAGLPLEGTGEASARKKLSGNFDVDTEKSVVHWVGRNLFNSHQGTVQLSSGSLTIKDDVLVGAEFILDMRSIVNTDLTDSTWNAMLLKHLSTDDFFSTNAYPTARFVAENAEPIHECTEGTPNYKIRGQFTLRGITNPLSFPAVIAQEDENHITGQAVLDLDRTQFGSEYGSGRFFAALGKHVVNDIIHLHLKICAKREGIKPLS